MVVSNKSIFSIYFDWYNISFEFLITTKSSYATHVSALVAFDTDLFNAQKEL